MFGQSPFEERQPSFSCEMQGQVSRSHRKLAFKVLFIVEVPCFQRAGSLQNEERAPDLSPLGWSFPAPPGAEPPCALRPQTEPQGPRTCLAVREGLLFPAWRLEPVGHPGGRWAGLAHGSHKGGLRPCGAGAGPPGSRSGAWPRTGPGSHPRRRCREPGGRPPVLGADSAAPDHSVLSRARAQCGQSAAPGAGGGRPGASPSRWRGLGTAVEAAPRVRPGGGAVAFAREPRCRGWRSAGAHGGRAARGLWQQAGSVRPRRSGPGVRRAPCAVLHAPGRARRA